MLNSFVSLGLAPLISFVFRGLAPRRSHGLFDAQSLSKETPTLLFEVQWRPRMESAIPKWETSAHLLRSNICRKKNLRPSTCYEFRYADYGV